MLYFKLVAFQALSAAGTLASPMNGCNQSAHSVTVNTTSEKSTLFQRGDSANTTEDCLRLSIFAPKTTVERAASNTTNSSNRGDGLPIVVWIHGGGFSIGGTNVPYQLSPSWVERSQAHIVVQVQYRLNLLGQPNAAGLAMPHSSSGRNENFNFGLLDQRLAVEWVRDNIDRFGGDPDRITLWGQSAGAYNSDGYLFAWAKTQSVFSTAARRLGCGNLNPTEELACMRAVPASDIKKYLQGPAGAISAANDSLVFSTVIDNVTFFPDYPGRIQAKDTSLYASGIPLLTSTTTDEGTAVVPYEFDGSVTATELPPELAEIADAFTRNLRCTTLQDVKLRAGGSPSAFEEEVSRRMQDLYLEFIKDPAEGLKRAGWPPATGNLQDRNIMAFAVDGNLEQLISANQQNLGQGCA
ncbi:hypothetical protein CIB48_g5824 [Xylaria polymorpha]|nr:hypothetical protein CIB48_g5824 [Xylaria polymorpha]